MFEKFFETLSLRQHRLVSGENVYSANVYVKEKWRPLGLEKNTIYADCDGSGTSQYKSDAIYKAISEGLERISFYQNFSSEKYGFEIDRSTSGMAAYPGIFKSYARSLANGEAAERWSLAGFWCGQLGVELLMENNGERVFRIRNPFSLEVILIDRQIKMDGRRIRSYGFAASKTFSKTLFKARVELDRNLEALRGFWNKGEDSQLSLIEKRLVFFSQSEGADLFESKIALAKSILEIPSLPSLLIDTEIVGPWSAYSHVYRVLYEAPCSDSTNINDFSF